MRTPSPRALVLAALLGSAAPLVPSPALAQYVANDEAGRQRFQVARQHFERQEFAAALTEFRASMQLLPSPNTRLYVGRALRELGQYPDAWNELTLAATEAAERARTEARYARTADAARAEAAALAGRVGLLTVSVSAPVGEMTVLVNGTPVAQGAWNSERAITPSDVTIEARAPGYAPFRATGTVAAGQRARVEIRLDPTSQLAPATTSTTSVVTIEGSSVHDGGGDGGSSGLRTAGVVTVGLGLALGVAGGVAGVMALSEYNSLDSDCAAGARCGPTASQDIRDRVAQGETLGTLTTIGLVSGGVLIGAGLVMFFAGAGAESASPRATPYIDVARGVAGLQGRF